HHTVSGRIIRQDEHLRQWFSETEIETMAQAAEDHRASAQGEPRSLYGKIVAEADRDIEPTTIVRRTVQYGLSHYPDLDREGHWQRTLQHLNEKYAEGGYLKLYIPCSRNWQQMQKLRQLIADRTRLRTLFDQIIDKERKTTDN
ncbi:MAG: phosphohydrolase, partial [Bacteroidales bacterium]|nr:phosphohydrolase [Bacteroidales bacterium]